VSLQASGEFERLLEEVFPFYIACDADARVVSVGRSLRKILPGKLLQPGESSQQLLQVLRPHGARSLCALGARGMGLVVIKLVIGLQLRGQVFDRGERGAVFVGTPWFEDVDEAMALGLTVDDFAPYDAVADYVLLLSQVRGQLLEGDALAQRLTEEIRKAEKLRDDARAAKEQAIEASKARDRFLAMMSHELRTPLTTILATNQLMLMGDLSPSQREHALAQKRAGAALLALINSVLDISKLQAGKFDLVPESFEPRVAVEDVVGSMRDEAERKGLLLEWVASSAVPTMVRGDPVRFRQMLTNYVANAIKFTERGGVIVRMDVRETSEHRCKIVVAVTDTGIGIKSEHIDSLFKPFVQVHRDRGTGHLGTGLGLSICKQIAELMGGSVWVTSKWGKGSTFWFDGWFELETVPRTRRTGQFQPLSIAPPPALLPMSESKSAPSPSGHVPRLLVVEDDPVNRRLLALLVESMGYVVDVASDGAAAVEAVRGGSYSLVLMDCSMPGMDGFEATAAIRQLPPPLCDIPVIAVTAHALEGDRERCLREGMDDYLTKPFNPSQIRQTLSQWVPLDAGAKDVAGTAMPTTQGLQSSRSDVDLSVLRALKGYQRPGEPDLVAEVVALFESDARERVAELERAVEARSVAAVRLHAHALKGAASNVGARKVERLARWIERVDPLDDWELTRDLARALAAEIEHAIVLLRTA
jgi:signal transduction histidine kinase/CheY-like chemotaxis protein/HPt (histidine-containing phosphotransfer) domain-containing protein